LEKIDKKGGGKESREKILKAIELEAEFKQHKNF